MHAAVPNTDRMFQVIVLGGLALTTGAAFSAAGCANAGTSAGAGLDVDAGSDAAAVTEAGQDAYDAFPHEGPDIGPPIDSGQDDAFPDDGPDASNG